MAESGLVDVNGHALARDIDENPAPFRSAGSTMAAAFSAAILIVAANWDELPRLARVGLLFAHRRLCRWRVLKRGREARRMRICTRATAFGASTALIAQMYHLSGDETRRPRLVHRASRAAAPHALVLNGVPAARCAGMRRWKGD